MEGIVIINKPSGITSHDVVMKVRRKFHIKRVGHAGTLDPLASGVLVILIGKATKLSNHFTNFDKAYRSTFILGRKTDTADIEGKVTQQMPCGHISKDDINLVLPQFQGALKQMVPMYSAVKVKGRKLYEYARKGIVVDRPVRDITIDCLTLEEFSSPYAHFYIECSKGTYVRQLAEDIGEQLGCGACVSQIERTKVGHFTINDAINIEDLDESCIRDWTDPEGS